MLGQGVTEAVAPLRVVLDTNVVLSTLLFRGAVMRHFSALWQQERIQPVVSKPIVQELLRVLAYPRFRLTTQDTEDLLADYLPHCEVVNVEGHFNLLMQVNQCRDVKDQMFLDASQIAGVDFLVSGDDDLHAVNDPLGTHHRFQICKPAEMLSRFGF